MARAMSETQSLPKQQMFIDGEWTESASGEYFESFDPYTAKPWTLVPRGNAEDVKRAVAAAQEAFPAWAKTPAPARGRIISKVAALAMERSAELGAIMSLESGKIQPEAAGEIHTDFQRGFIRAEVTSYDDFVALGGEQGAKEAGRMRLEGKDYVVREGDVIYFRFNV